MRIPRDGCALSPRLSSESHCFLLGLLFNICTGLVVLIFLSADAGAGIKLGRKKLQAALDSVPDESGERTLSPYFYVFTDEKSCDVLPLRSTRVDVNISGPIARARITQHYRNEGNRPLEAVYLFPASIRAAVHAMRMQVGERTIEARIQESEAAREEYDEALKKGCTASLLTQVRPNVFQMAVGNILPGDEIDVVLEYTELLRPKERVYEFVYPTVTGPRYSNRPADLADDREEWVENPYLHEGQAAAFTFGIDVFLQSGVPVTRVHSPSHDVGVEFKGRRSVVIRQPENRLAGTRDFVLRYSLAGENIEHGLLLAPGEEENFFLLTVEPPRRLDPDEIVDREFIFVMDVSGSMSGYPLECGRQFMRDLLSGLGKRDSFNLLLFAGSNAVLSDYSLPASGENIQAAIDMIDGQQAGGGTEILPALRRAFDLPQDKNDSRVIVIVTDGYVTVEREAFELVRRKLRQASVFTFGVGTAVNRHLIEGLARIGLGESFVALDSKEASRKAERFKKYVSAPLLSGVEIIFEDFDVYDVTPSAVPDMFSERPLVLFGKYRDKAKGSVEISGHAVGQELRGRVAVADALVVDDPGALRSLWARQKVQELNDSSALLGEQGLKDEVIRLGLKYGLLTDYTSFVAVDTEIRSDGKKASRVRQPLPLPVGVGDTAVGMSSRNALGPMPKVGGLPLQRLPRARSYAMGSIDRSTIQKTIRKNMRSVQACYEKALKSNPSLQGKVVVEFSIGSDGSVSNARIVQSTVPDLEMQSDILDVIRRMKFDKPPGGGSITVTYPFVFRSI